MLKSKVFRATLVILLTFTLLIGCSSTSSGSSETEGSPESNTSNYPENPIEIVVPNNAGGGTDIFARTLEEIIRENKFVDVNMTILNKGGGSGAIGNSYVLTKSNTDNTLLTVSTAFWTTPLSGSVPYSYEDFTPIVDMAIDPLILMVNKDCEFNTLEEILEFTKKNPKKFIIGGTSITSEGSILTHAIKNESGAEFKYIPYDSSAEAVTGLLGGHIDGSFINPSEAGDHVKVGNFKTIAVATEERLEEFPDVPTIMESGLDVSIAQHRHVVGPPGMSEEAVSFWGDVFKKVYDTPEFKEYLNSNSLTGHFYGPEEYATYIKKIGNTYKPLIEEIMEEKQ